MAPGVSLDDRSAWDDSALINSWDEAVGEYEKYHSISRSGRRLEDVLSEEELRELRKEHGNVLDDTETRCCVADRNNHADHGKAPLPQETTNDDAPSSMNEAHAEEEPVSGLQEYASRTETATQHAHAEPQAEPQPAVSMPQVLLGNVQDENMKNLMMSWYYAGYYTGLQAGQQRSGSNVTDSK